MKKKSQPKTLKWKMPVKRNHPASQEQWEEWLAGIDKERAMQDEAWERGVLMTSILYEPPEPVELKTSIKTLKRFKRGQEFLEEIRKREEEADKD